MDKFKNIKKGLNRIVSIIQMYLSCLYKRDENVIVFGAWFAEKYDDNSRYLYEYIVKHMPEIEAYWFTSSKEIYDRLCQNNMPVCMCYSKKSKKILKRAGYVFTVTDRSDIGKENIKYLGGCTYINLWHGIPLKKIMHDDVFAKKMFETWYSKLRIKLEKIPLRNTYVISTSEKVTEIYMSAFQKKRENILCLGQPRNDYFYSEDKNSYKDRFEGKKIVVYMPTHRKEGKVAINTQNILDLDKLNTFCEENNIIFLIKKHFYHAGERDMENKFSSIIDITNETTNSQELLKAADILITDYSSCYIDYLLLDRPLLFYAYDLEAYKHNDREMYFDYETVTPGKKCLNYKQVEEELKNIISGKDEFAEERKRVQNLFYSPQNQKPVAKKIIEYVKDMPKK